MKIKTSRFGELDITEDQVYRFPEGMLGFEKATQFTILIQDNNQSLFWLQSLDMPEVAFLMVNPLFVKSDYQIFLQDHDRSILNIVNESNESLDFVKVFVILIVYREQKKVTANLLAPLVINDRDKLGKQVVLNGSNYEVEYLIQGITPGSAVSNSSQCVAKTGS